MLEVAASQLGSIQFCVNIKISYRYNILKESTYSDISYWVNLEDH